MGNVDGKILLGGGQRGLVFTAKGWILVHAATLGGK
jgi:hypothetical protein